MSEKPEEQTESGSELEKLTEALAEEKKRSEEYLTRMKYMQADFENLKKRMDRQMEEVKKYSNERIIIELLEIVDELETAIKASHNSDSKETVIQGVEMTLKKLRKILEKEGISPIECVGKPFDPSKHNAVARIEKKDADECTVVEEVRKGYAMRENVIRPSIVKVMVKPSKSQEKVNQNE